MPRRADQDADAQVRVVGGRWRGTPLAYHGDRVTRPMKHRVREAIFNLVGPAVQGSYAIDVFAGTGALGIEALSRGATRALFIERHIPTAAIVKQNLATVGAGDVSDVVVTSSFLWSKRDLPKGVRQRKDGEDSDAPPLFARPHSLLPWVVFVSPPYSFFVDRRDEMLALIEALLAASPQGSLMVVESDERFDFAALPGGVRPDRHSAGWDVRSYPPAVVGVWRKQASDY